jgi:hypothetical protein
MKSAPARGACAMSSLIFKRASASRPSGEWKEDDYDVLADGTVVGRIMRAAASPEGSPWLWTLAFGHHETAHRPPLAKVSKTYNPPKAFLHSQDPTRT